MLQAFINMFKIAELRNKLLFTLGMLVIFRIGHWIPLPGVNQDALSKLMESQQQEGSLIGQITMTVSIFSGGQLAHSTIFGLGIMPYISASIIFQLLGQVLPSLKALRNEGPTGARKIQEWSRLATVGLAALQAIFWLKYLSTPGHQGGSLVYANWVNNPLWWVMGVMALTAGTMFLVWLGEQIDRFGIGNGTSLIIAAGILTQMPRAILDIASSFKAAPGADFGFPELFFVILMFVGVTGGAVIMTIAQRRIPIQQAKHTRGRKVYGGQRQFLPLRVNHGGVMPVIFASSLMIFPPMIFKALSASLLGNTPRSEAGSFPLLMEWLADNLSIGKFPYVMCELILIYFFSYFWITVQLNPEEMSKNLRDHGSFIPGLRPGPRTAEYIETVMERITYVGAAFLALIALAPMVIQSALGLPPTITQFLGGTGLLIVVSVVLDFIQRVEANLLMRNYAGFLSGSESSSGRRMAGAPGM